MRLANASPLFAFLPAQPALPKGIARMAAQSPVTDEGHHVEYHRMTAKSILNRSDSQRGLGFRWSINPYRGCEFGCHYCYARYTHEFMDLNAPQDFEQQIFIKENAAHLLEQELKHLPEGQTIAIGTATDPYQPIERKEELTRSLLQVLAKDFGRHRIGIVTKSVLILRDIDLLQEVAERHELTVNLTITTDDIVLARKLEPRAPRPDLRFRAVLRLREAGIRVGVLCSPAMPGINDSQPQLDRMAYLAAAAKASFFASGALFLKPGTKHVFEAFIGQEFPHLLPDLRRRFASGAFQSRDYQAVLDARVMAACQRHGLNRRPENDLLSQPRVPVPGPVAVPSRPVQAELSFGGAGGFAPAPAFVPDIRVPKTA
jgi:DNA repair photolyase